MPHGHSSSRNPSPGPWAFSRLHSRTKRSTVASDPPYPSSETSLSYTRLAVCRCLRGLSRSPSSHDRTARAYGSIVGLVLGLATGGSGEKSPFEAYLATVFLLIPSSRAISRCERPSARIVLISSCFDRGMVMFPSSPSGGTAVEGLSPPEGHSTTSPGPRRPGSLFTEQKRCSQHASLPSWGWLTSPAAGGSIIGDGGGSAQIVAKQRRLEAPAHPRSAMILATRFSEVTTPSRLSWANTLGEP